MKHNPITIENTIVYFIFPISNFLATKQKRESAISIKIDMYELVCHI